jgi:3-phenylpropionate/cinnamic acid dioxygenase small subunit
MISNVRILKQQDSVIEVKANWLVNSHGLHGTLLRGGHYEYQLLHLADRLKIVTKKVILINDKLVGPVDVFHV